MKTEQERDSKYTTWRENYGESHVRPKDAWDAAYEAGRASVSPAPTIQEFAKQVIALTAKMVREDDASSEEVDEAILKLAGVPMEYYGHCPKCGEQLGFGHIPAECKVGTVAAELATSPAPTPQLCKCFITPYGRNLECPQHGDKPHAALVATEPALCQFCKQPMTDNGNGVFTCNNKGCKAPQYNGATELGTAHEPDNYDPRTDPQGCDCSRGDIQCPYKLPHGDDEWLFCGRKTGHTEYHRTGYIETRPHLGWLLDETVSAPTDSEREWARKLAAIIVAGEGQCPICDWSLAESLEKGCIIGNCSFRSSDETVIQKLTSNRGRWQTMADLILAHLPRGRQEWIDCRQRLPAQEGFVTVLIGGVVQRTAARLIIGESDRQEWEWATDADNAPLRVVSHWAALPAPPESKP